METYYLEMNQTIPEGDVSTLAVEIRVRVADQTEAEALKAELANRFFSGLTYVARLHVHRTDGPCEVSDL